MMTVEPSPATTGTPLLVTVDSRESFFCHLFDPAYLDGRVVVINATTFCGSSPPGLAESLFTLLPPLDAGIWQIQLNNADLPVNYPLAVIETDEVRVTDPRYAVELDPGVATEDDEVVARLEVFGTCPEFDPPEVSPGLIRIEGREQDTCVPVPPSPIELDLPLGQLDAGSYLVELHYRLNELRRVAENQLSVLPAGACVPNARTLCLSDGRFRVKAYWTTQLGGPSGPGTAVEESDETGAFWFFSADNVELVVKVLDGCATPLESFWVFAAGLTDVGVVLEVTDTASGIMREYENPVGRPFETITDTGAFLTCP